MQPRTPPPARPGSKSGPDVPGGRPARGVDGSPPPDQPGRDDQRDHADQRADPKVKVGLVWPPPSSQDAHPADDRVPPGERGRAAREPQHACPAVDTDPPLKRSESDLATPDDNRHTQPPQARPPRR